jgi:hypothetical protein
VTSPLLKAQPKRTFVSLAVFVFIAHTVISVLVWFSAGDERPLEISESMFKLLFFPLYLLITSSFYHDLPYRNLPESLSGTIVFLCWLLSAVLWSVLIAASVVAVQRLHTKSSNQTLQPTAGRRDV